MTQNARFSKWNIQIILGIHSRISILGYLRFEPRPPLVANRKLCYCRTWDICGGNEIYVTIVFFGYLCLKTTPGTSQGMIQSGRTDKPNLLHKNSLPLKVIAKIHSLECKANFIDNYFYFILH